MAFKDIIGQEKAVGILKSQLLSKRIAHSYIFLGPDGVGKKKTALELAKALNCGDPENPPCGECNSCRKIDNQGHPDVHLIDHLWQSAVLEEELPKSGRDVIKIGTIRAIQKEISMKLFEGRCRVFIIDSAETLNKEAANCFLKTLEEPSQNSLIILITTTLETLPGTVISRCQQVRFRELPGEFIAKWLKENRDIDDEKAALVAAISQGSLGRAIMLEDSFDEPFGIRATAELWDKLSADRIDAVELLEFCNRISRNRDSVEKFIANLLNLARNGLVSKIGDRARDVLELILTCRNSMRYNINLSMLLSFMLLQLKEIFHAGSR